MIYHIVSWYIILWLPCVVNFVTILWQRTVSELLRQPSNNLDNSRQACSKVVPARLIQSWYNNIITALCCQLYDNLVTRDCIRVVRTTLEQFGYSRQPCSKVVPTRLIQWLYNNIVAALHTVIVDFRWLYKARIYQVCSDYCYNYTFTWSNLQYVCLRNGVV